MGSASFPYDSLLLRLPDTDTTEAGCLEPKPQKKKHVGNQFPSVPGSECLFVPSDAAKKANMTFKLAVGSVGKVAGDTS